MVEIDHGNGIATRYGHLSGIAVSEGQAIEAGTVLGRISSTGRATGPHLHYEVRIDNEPVDPARFLRAAVKLTSTDYFTSSTFAAPPPSTRWASEAAMNPSRSPSSTSLGVPEVTPVRRSFTSW
jgi:hypothetical protein